MTPLSVDLPHQLGRAEARRRIENGSGSLGRHLPAGATVQSAWAGDRLNLTVGLMGQEVRAAVDVQEAIVRVEIVLPPALGFFRPIIEAGIRRGGEQMLEDKSKTKS
jgi:putative polyhydroxyalkanoate system protein